MRTVLVLLFIALFLILSIPVMLVEWIIGKFNQDLKDLSSLRIVQWAFRCIIFLCGTKMTVIGEENVPKGEPVLYIGNHRSLFDTVLTYARTPGLCGYISKKEMFKVPLVPIWMRNLYCIFLDRDDLRKGLEMVLTAIKQVKRGISICIFPEGTRNDGSVDFLPFRNGCLKISEKTGCAVVPMAINNSADIFELHKPWIRRTHVVLEYCRPIYPKDFPKEERGKFAEIVEQTVKDTYYKNQKLV